MFRFAHPHILYLLCLIVFFTIAYIIIQYRQGKNLNDFGDYKLIKALMPDVSKKRRNIKFILQMLMLGLIVVMMARPQFGSRTEHIKEHEGIEVVIAVDVSTSMLCEDISPNRLERTKMLVSKLIEQLDNDRVGIVAFAGTATTLLPITSDYISAKMFLNQLTPSTISIQGTNIADAINRSAKSFSDNPKIGKALILITDVEDHELSAINAAEDISRKGIKIIVLSVGTPNGGPIPIGNGLYKKDKQGNIVTTKLNEHLGKNLAKAANGVYLNVNQTNVVNNMLVKELSNMKKDIFNTTQYSEYDEGFIGVTIVLLIIYLLEICIIEKDKKAKHLNLF